MARAAPGDRLGVFHNLHDHPGIFGNIVLDYSTSGRSWCYKKLLGHYLARFYKACPSSTHPVVNRFPPCAFVMRFEPFTLLAIHTRGGTRLMISAFFKGVLWSFVINESTRITNPIATISTHYATLNAHELRELRYVIEMARPGKERQRFPRVLCERPWGGLKSFSADST